MGKEKSPRKHVQEKYAGAYSERNANGYWSILLPYEFAKGAQTIGMGTNPKQAWIDAYRLMKNGA